MSASTARNSFAYNKPTGNDRQQGTPVITPERWWQDRYNDIAEQGYRLHPRYNPQWVPSWFKTDSGQATIVRIVAFLSCPSPQIPQVQGGNGRESHTRWSSSHA